MFEITIVMLETTIYNFMNFMIFDDSRPQFL